MTKVGLSVHDDFSVMRRTEPLEPQGFVELQHYVRDFCISDSSLQKIYAIVFGQRISKKQRLTNWEADKLTPQQQAYAALDSWACLHIYRYLSEGRFDPSSSPYRVIPEEKKRKHEKDSPFHPDSACAARVSGRDGYDRLRRLCRRRTSALYYFGIIAITLVILVLLHFSLKRRERMRAEREADIKKNSNQ